MGAPDFPQRPYIYGGRTHFGKRKRHPSAMRTVLFQGEQSNQTTIPCYDEAGKQRVSEAGKDQVHTGHTAFHLTPTLGQSGPLNGSLLPFLQKGNLESDVLEFSTQTASSPHTGSLLKLTLPCHYPSLWRGRKGDSGDLSILKILRFAKQ